MAYASIATLQLYLGLTSTGDNALLQQLLDAATALIDRHTGTRFGVIADSTRYLDAVADRDKRLLWLGTWLAAAPTTITNGDGTTVSGSDYVTEPRNGYPVYALRLKASSTQVWTYDDDAENAIAIVGKWGYSTTVPDDVEQACIRLAAYLYRQKDNAADLDRPVSLGGGVTILPAQLPRDIAEMLRPYRWLVG